MLIIDFYAEWCGTCRKLMPVIDDIAKDYDVLKVDIDVNKETAEKYNVSSLPTIIILVDDVEKYRFNGLVTKKKILNKIHQIEDEK